MTAAGHLGNCVGGGASGRPPFRQFSNKSLRRGAGFLCLLLALNASAADITQEAILARVSEEAEAFRQKARNLVATETLIHHGIKPTTRFLIFRRNNPAAEPPPPVPVNREIVSEYGFSTFAEAPEALREFRQVISVDGKAVTTREKARLALALNMTSDDDRLRKRMLQDFEQYGIVGAATDFGQMILLFQRRSLASYDFATLPEARLGAEECLVLHYRQNSGPDGVRVFTGKTMEKLPLEGEIWVRKADLLPLRITMTAILDEGNDSVNHSATIDYVQSRLGFLLPASVRYTRRAGERTTVENVSTYAEYKMFQSDAEIKFTSEDPQQ